MQEIYITYSCPFQNNVHYSTQFPAAKHCSRLHSDWTSVFSTRHDRIQKGLVLTDSWVNGLTRWVLFTTEIFKGTTQAPRERIQNRIVPIHSWSNLKEGSLRRTRLPSTISSIKMAEEGNAVARIDPWSRRELGNSGIFVSPIGFGASPLGNVFGRIEVRLSHFNPCRT